MLIKVAVSVVSSTHVLFDRTSTVRFATLPVLVIEYYSEEQN